MIEKRAAENAGESLAGIPYVRESRRYPLRSRVQKLRNWSDEKERRDKNAKRTTVVDRAGMGTRVCRL